MTRLEELEPGETAVIAGLEPNDDASSDLMELGMTAGTPIKLIKFAPLGDPLEVSVRGYHLSICRAEAKSVLVERENQKKQNCD